MLDETDETSERLDVDVLDVATVQKYIARFRVIETADKTSDCGLAASGKTDDGSQFAWIGRSARLLPFHYMCATYQLRMSKKYRSARDDQALNYT